MPSPAPGDPAALGRSDEQPVGPLPDNGPEPICPPSVGAVDLQGTRSGDLDQDRTAGTRGDPRVREVGASREPTTHGRPLPGSEGVHLDLAPAVAGVPGGHHIVTPEELPVGYQDRGGTPVEEGPPVHHHRQGPPPVPPVETVRRRADHDRVHCEVSGPRARARRPVECRGAQIRVDEVGIDRHDIERDFDARGALPDQTDRSREIRVGRRVETNPRDPRVLAIATDRGRQCDVVTGRLDVR